MTRSSATVDDARALLGEFEGPGPRAHVSPLGNGLIHDTFAVSDAAGEWVLQRVHPRFARVVHFNIDAVTRRLAQEGVTSLELVRTQGGALWAERGGEVWRLMTRLRGVSFDAVRWPEQAEAAAYALGRFHGALTRLEHTFVGIRAFVHDTPRHLEHLREAVREHEGHRLHHEVTRLTEEILAGAEALPVVHGVPDRIVHGDPKFNNALFEGREGEAALRVVGWVDLDTVAPMPLHLELGDAWRSWCNKSGEDDEEARFDLEIFAASIHGYRRANAFALAAEEREALLHGVEWITLELASRFAADALRESYFGWDRTRYPAAGEHNLVRAWGQLRLHRQVLALRAERAALLAPL